MGQINLRVTKQTVGMLSLAIYCHPSQNLLTTILSNSATKWALATQTIPFSNIATQRTLAVLTTPQWMLVAVITRPSNNVTQ